MIFQYSTTSRNGWNWLCLALYPNISPLSVLNHESKRLERTDHLSVYVDIEKLSVLNHESKRLERIFEIIKLLVFVSFSTQPRVETAGTCDIWRMTPQRMTFQYSTTSRNGWNGLWHNAGTLVFSLSVLNHESKRLEPSCEGLSLKTGQAFSTQPRVETAGTLQHCNPHQVGGMPFSTQPRVETAGTKGTAYPC